MLMDRTVMRQKSRSHLAPVLIIETQTNPPAYLWDTKKVLAMKTVSICWLLHLFQKHISHGALESEGSCVPVTVKHAIHNHPLCKSYPQLEQTHITYHRNRRKTESQWQSILLQGASLKKEGNSLAVLWLGLTSNTRNTGLIPDQKTKILYAMWCSPDWVEKNSE